MEIRTRTTSTTGFLTISQSITTLSIQERSRILVTRLLWRKQKLDLIGHYGRPPSQRNIERFDGRRRRLF
jgi:hypothetical protein